MTRRERLRAHAVDECLAAIGEITEDGCAGDAEIEGLLACLESDHKVVQRHAAETLAALAQHDVAVRDALTAALHASTVRRRWGAAYALAQSAPLPPEVVPVLIDTLGADDGDLRWAAADILVHRSAHLDVLPELLAVLQRGTELQRKMAAYCVRDLGTCSAESQRALLRCLHDPEAPVRLAALAAIAKVPWERPTAAYAVAQLLNDADTGVRRAAAVALGNLGERSDDILTALRAASEASDPSLQRAALRSMRLLVHEPAAR